MRGGDLAELMRKVHITRLRFKHPGVFNVNHLFKTNTTTPPNVTEVHIHEGGAVFGDYNRREFHLAANVASHLHAGASPSFHNCLQSGQVTMPSSWSHTPRSTFASEVNISLIPGTTIP